MKRLFALLVLVMTAAIAFGQAPPAMLGIHEDVVKPSMDSKFREGVKKLKAACEQSKTSFGWTTIAFDDNSYAHVFPLTKYGDLDKNPFADLEAKIGGETVGKLFGEMDACLEKHFDFVVTPLPSLSYLTPAAGENSRDFLFWTVFPGKEREAEAIIAEWKKLYESKKAPAGFLVSKIAMGMDMGYAIVAWGKDPVDIATKDAKTHELTNGEEAGKLWARTQAITQKFSNKRATVLPELSYTPAKQ